MSISRYIKQSKKFLPMWSVFNILAHTVNVCSFRITEIAMHQKKGKEEFLQSNHNNPNIFIQSKTSYKNTHNPFNCSKSDS